MRFQPGPQVQIAAVDRISHDPANGDLSLPHASEHLGSQFWLCLEAHRVCDACSSTPIPILSPVQGQIQFAINEGMAFSRHIGEKNPHLTILHLSSGPAILQPNPCRIVASFGKTAFVNDQDSGLLAQLLKGIGTQIITHPIGVPDGAGQQALHAIRTNFSCVFSSLPAIFACCVAEDSLQIGQRPATRLRTGKAWSNTSMQVKKGLDPTADIGGGRSASATGGVLILLHDLLL
jgi:hypothetical protein